jgi:hypothetical protein
VLPSPRSPERAQGCIRSRDATRLKLATFMSGDGQRVQTFGPRVSGAQALWDSAGGSHPANSAHGWTTARLSTGGPLRPPPVWRRMRSQRRRSHSLRRICSAEALIERRRRRSTSASRHRRGSPIRGLARRGRFHRWRQAATQAGSRLRRSSDLRCAPAGPGHARPFGSRRAAGRG